jgi:hypothetical protein
MRFVCWLWRGNGFWKETARYDGRHVATLASMLRRHGGHELICIHDGGFELPRSVEGIHMPTRVRKLPDYLPKLWAWSPELHALIGERFASIDLDVVLLGDVAPLLAGPGVRMWGQGAARHEPYNTSLFVPGIGFGVWESYSPERLAAARAAAPYWTGDQSWVAHVLGPDMPTFGEADGVVRYRGGLHREAPPSGCKAMFFCWPMCPRTEAEHSEWVRREWL